MSKVKVTGSQNAIRRWSGQHELCTLSSTQPLVNIVLIDDDDDGSGGGGRVFVNLNKYL